MCWNHEHLKSGPTWKPPESVSIGRRHPVNSCSPPSRATRPLPGRFSRWYVFPSISCAPVSSSCCGVTPLTVPAVVQCTQLVMHHWGLQQSVVQHSQLWLAVKDSSALNALGSTKFSSSSRTDQLTLRAHWHEHGRVADAVAQRQPRCPRPPLPRQHLGSQKMCSYQLQYEQRLDAASSQQLPTQAPAPTLAHQQRGWQTSQTPHLARRCSCEECSQSAPQNAGQATAMMTRRQAAQLAAVHATAVAAPRLGMLHLLSWTPVLQPDTPPQLPVAVLQTLCRWPPSAGHCKAMVSRHCCPAD